MQGTPEDHNATAGSEHCSHDDSQIINVGFQICNHKDLLVRKESKCTKKKKKALVKQGRMCISPLGMWTILPVLDACGNILYTTGIPSGPLLGSQCFHPAILLVSQFRISSAGTSAS